MRVVFIELLKSLWMMTHTWCCDSASHSQPLIPPLIDSDFGQIIHSFEYNSAVTKHGCHMSHHHWRLFVLWLLSESHYYSIITHSSVCLPQQNDYCTGCIFILEKKKKKKCFARAPFASPVLQPRPLADPADLAFVPQQGMWFCATFSIRWRCRCLFHC